MGLENSKSEGEENAELETSVSETLPFEEDLPPASGDDSEGLGATQKPDDSQGLKGRIKLIVAADTDRDVVALRKIFDAAKKGQVKLVLDLLQKLRKKEGIAYETPLGEYLDKPLSLLGKITPLVVLCQNMERLYSEGSEIGSKPGMSRNMVDAFIELITFDEVQSVDKDDGIHLLNRGGEKSAEKCLDKFYEKFHLSWSEEDKEHFLEITQHLKGACSRVALRMAANTAEMAKKEPSENTSGSADTRSSKGSNSKEPSENAGSRWNCLCFFSFWKKPKAALPREMESVTKIEVHTMTDTRSSKGSNSDTSGTPSPSSSAKALTPK